MRSLNPFKAAALAIAVVGAGFGGAVALAQQGGTAPTARPAPAATPPAAIPPAMAVPLWTVAPPPQSALIFRGTHAGNEFRGEFRLWSAAIRFDPANLSGSSIEVTVNPASAVTGNAEYDRTLPQAEWLNTRNFPRATFRSTRIRSLGGNRYAADGTLTLKDVSVPLSLGFTLDITGNTAVATGAANLDRIALNVGKASDPSAEWVSRQIRIGFQLRATKR
jgi:polyisoprenoid-binding protein YceI